MNALENELVECCNRLTSDKITERKKGATVLKDLLYGDTYIQTLDRNSRIDLDSPCSWNSLFTASHHALVKEVDKYHGKADPKNCSTRENNKRSFTSLVTIIAKHGTEGGEFFKCSTIIDAVIHVLKSPHYRNEIGSVYLNILYENVLSVPKYWGAIKLEDWKILFELCIEIFENRNNPIPHSKISITIAIMNLIVKYGCEHSSLAVVIKKRIFEFLKNMLQMTLTESADFQFHSLKLVLTVCEKLKKESRFTICKFTEEIFDRLFDIGRALHDKEKQFLYDILLLAVECHHPNGVTQKSGIEAHAQNWDDWNRKLKQLNHTISVEFDDNKQKYRKLQTLPKKFVNLAVEVLNQIFRSGCHYIEVTVNSFLNNSISGERGSSSKRRRIMCGFTDIMDRLKMESDPIDMWPWLSVITSLISRYPNIVNDCDYMMLLQNMYKFLSASKERTVTDYLCQCCIALIDVRRNGHLEIDHQEEEPTWDSIWNLVLRTIGLNQNLEWSHKLLQHIMNHKWKATMGNSVLKLYLSQVVRLSAPSLMTLRLLRLRVSFPLTILDIPVHSTLLRWLLPVTSEYSSAGYFLMDLSLDHYAHATVLVCLQNNVKEVPKNLVPLEFNSSSRLNTPISAAEIHKLSSYNCDIFNPECDEEDLTVPETEGKGCTLNNDAFERFLNLLEDHQESVFELEICKATIDAITNGQHVNLNDAFTTVKYLNSFIVFLVHVERFVESYVSYVNTIKLRKIFEEILRKLLMVNRHLLVTDLSVDKQIELWSQMSRFFQQIGSQPPHLIEQILENFFPLLEPAVDCMEDRITEENPKDDEKYSGPRNEDESLFETENLSKSDRLKLEAAKMLLYYSFNRNYICGTQYKVLGKVLEILIEIFTKTGKCSRAFFIMSTFTLQTVFNLNKSWYKDEDEELDVDLFSYAIRVIEGICSADDSKWCTIAESSLVLLKLIQQAIETSYRLNNTSEWEELAIFIRKMKTAIPDCGSQISLEMARSLSLFKIKCNIRLNGPDDSAVNILMSTTSELLKYLKSPFHEVRATIISWLPSVLRLMDWVASEKNISSHTTKIMDDFHESLLDVFVVEDTIADELDESINRPLTAIYALGSAICNSKTTRRRQIFYLFYITHDKHLNPVLTFKILNLVGKHLKKDVNDLIKDNLMFVLFSWYTKFKSFKEFPFRALGRESIKDFYSVHMKEVVAVLLYFTDIEKLEMVSSTIQTSLTDLVKGCFPEIMAILLKKIVEARNFSGNSKTNAATVQEFIVSTLTNEGVETMTIEKLADVLTCILRHLHDPNFQITKPCILPLPTALASNAPLVRETIKYLQEMMGTDTELIVYIAEHYPKVVQKIFQKLYVDVMKASTPEIKLESLQKYVLFCEILTPHHADLSKYRIGAFITRTIIKNLLCFLSTDKSELAFLKSTLQFFLKFISRWLLGDESYAETVRVFSECLSSIVNKLVIVMSRNNELDEDALNVLRYLLSERYDVLSACVDNLEQFPDRPEFDEFRLANLEMLETQTEGSSLRNDIKLFLNASENSAYSPCRVESLKYLRKQLCGYKFELTELFKSCIFQEPSSEDNGRNTAHCLICTLIQQTKCTDDEVKYEAVRCLSEIGLVNLHTLVLKHNNCEETIQADCALETFVAENVCAILQDCIVDEDVDLVNAACRVLYLTLFSREGFEVISTYRHKPLSSSLQKSFIYPFIPLSSESVNKENVWHYFSIAKFKEQIDSEFLWSPIEDSSYATWIQNLVSAICNSFNKKCFLNAIQTVCKLKVSVAESMFKYLVNLLTACHVQEPAEVFGGKMNEFLKNYFNSNAWENLPDSLSSSVSCRKEINNSIYHEKASIQILLDAANFVRLSRPVEKNDLKLNYLYVAKAALQCNAYFTCILYCELYLNSLIKQYPNAPYDGNLLSYLEEIGNESSANQNELLNILREAFSRIGDSDALYGCSSSLLLHSEARILHYQQIENWQRVIESCDTNLACTPSQTGRLNDLTFALDHSGFNYLQKLFLTSLEQPNPRLKEAQYQCAWKLGQWDIEEPCDEEKTFNYYQYAALKDIHLRNYEGVHANVEQAKKSLVHKISRIGLESTKNVYHVLAKLQCLQDIENFTYMTDLNDIIESWRTQDSLSVGLNFHHKQIIFNQRVRMVNADVEEARNFVLGVAKQARRERNFKFADLCLSLIKDKGESSNLTELRVRLEEARVLYDRSETYTARYLLKDLLKRDKIEESHTFHAILLRTYGKWLLETNLENADTIFENYFQPAADLVPKMPSETEKERKVRLKTYKQVAEFADLQYQHIAEYIKSDEFKEQVMNVDKSKENAAALNARGNRDLMKSKVMLTNQSKMEDSQVKEMQNKEKRYLMLAFKYYLKVLAECDEEDLKVFRVISFWLNQKTNIELHKELEEAISHIPSYKFLSVLPQLMAHVTRNTAQCFGNLLNNLLVKCACEHPHHTLPVIFSLVNYMAESKYVDSAPPSSSENEDRIVAATDLIRQLRSEKNIEKVIGKKDRVKEAHIKLGKFISEMEDVFKAYIELAYYGLATRPASVVTKIPQHLRIMKIKNFENTYCLTFTVPISKTGHYDNIVGIRHIENTFRYLGGNSAPKKIGCVCTDGQTRYQMVKGKDDIRVDAVMQQVFNIMNKLLSADKHTSKRELLLRTYKIVPLSQRSGVLEFCTNSMALGEYLAYVNDSRPGAHRRFRPQDMTTAAARKKIQFVREQVKDRKAPEEMRLKVFDDVCQALKPVFRYFFVEYFTSSSLWFERKLAYVHSVATTSMVGYILGLGDRHVQNILIDLTTAELVHIDFGIAFDQGMNLNTPERIPFRLTRDIEDGMGIFSIDGIFRRCCEQVMVVMRKNSEIIRTTSEVFIHDPLHYWTETPKENVAAADDRRNIPDDARKDLTTSRALSRLKLKLQGMEDGTPTSVEGQVNRLIQQAKDRRNLAVLYEGWQAYL